MKGVCDNLKRCSVSQTDESGKRRWSLISLFKVEEYRII